MNLSRKQLRRGLGTRRLPVPHRVNFSTLNKRIFPNTQENAESRKSVAMGELHRNNPNDPYNNEIFSKMRTKKNINTSRRKVLQKLKNKKKYFLNNTN